ncbi:MAG: adenosylcobalamin-dependent ribonucleoside-diphosphate reductase [Hyphomicrobium sp.]|nr:adenosylcobalamin-dependent ribonucleoside-diphosphate reductase [Hyphomicrobium sp.]
MSSASQFPAPIAQEIWEQKYRLKPPPGGDQRAASIDLSLDDTFRRVAGSVAKVEKGGKRVQARWADRFQAAMSDFSFLPAGRILAGAGSGREVTLFNCFVMGRIADDLGAIFENVKEAALTMQQGGGIGHDFSTLRPKGALVRSIGADASGPVSFMDVWDAMCRSIMSAGARRGAMMATLRCDHPDIEDFIDAKSEPGRLRSFNLSVLVTDAFMRAVEDRAPWPLQFEGKVTRIVEAKALWDRIMRATYDYAEPGVIFIDRVNERNNLGYCETIHATNPCGEQPLPPYGACLLGSLNLTRFVRRPFAVDADLDVARLEEVAGLATRFLDNVIDVSGYPLPEQRQEAKAKRRIGLGITGLADTLAMLGVRYGSDAAAALAGQWMAAIERSAYLASARLAREKGSFPLFDKAALLVRPCIAGLPGDVRREIADHGLRNGCLTSIAPTGTISLLAGNVSSGIEPIFDFVQRRRILMSDGTTREETIEDWAFASFRALHGPDAALPSAFVTVNDLVPSDHLRMQAAVQAHVDSSISKTINCPVDIPYADFEAIYREAYRLGLKGCTTYRPNPVTGAVLTSGQDEHEGLEAAAEPSRVKFAADQPSTAPAAAVFAAAARPAPLRTQGDIVYMAKPLARDAVLAGFTYKLKWPESEHAIYITINDIEMEGGVPGGPVRRRPFEIFINSRNLEHYAWTVALTRMISAVFRRGGDVSFVAEELKAVFDPQGGRWVGGRYVPSLLAAIGEVIETHMRRTGFMADPSTTTPEIGAARVAAAGGEGLSPQAGAGDSAGSAGGRPNLGKSEITRAPGAVAGGSFCPRCGELGYVKRDGCWVCDRCGFSRCG